ncbi:AfsR/SARP family transcriptional regulator [Kitasatospora sp. NBC_01287]|uniref:AfsR/SARP family transcriptional regulator n=1 Tax=Kitasatospora sp. NBC_01287 TaxID=2903573 RepID=UPI002256CBA8|nr:AfsR/SARP family transcriptional regulator [Kitasatospora sp. NBC_01287]MCX4751600.1 AfsR/SARP family transcriptional regulator [Kitasatospora sp. NBC_01287]
MRYELLGPLRVCATDGRVLTLSAPKAEVTLALLLLSEGRVVTKEQLTTELWGERPPRSASAAIHVYISQLRKFLADAGAGDPGCPAITTTASGYRFQRGGASYDAEEFTAAVRAGRARQAAGRPAAALESFELALALYRGSVLDGHGDGPVVSSFAAWAEEERLTCLELAIEARTTLGQHREVIGLLGGLTAEYPLRESFYRQLMLVLYRAERRAEALEVYSSARRVLRSELGLEPHRSLRRLHQAILSADRLLDHQPLAS